MTKLLKYSECVEKTFEFTKTKKEDWQSVPVKGFTAVLDGSGKERAVPEFDFPAGYFQIETPFSGSDCCNLCGRDIKYAYWIQNDGLKATMLVGCECVTHFGIGENGDQAAKSSIAASNRAFITEVYEILSPLYKLARYESAEISMGNYTGRKIMLWATHIPEGRKAKELYEKIRAVLKHSTGCDIRPGDYSSIQGGGPFVTDRVITNWKKKKGAAAEALLEEAKSLLSLVVPA